MKPTNYRERPSKWEQFHKEACAYADNIIFNDEQTILSINPGTPEYYHWQALYEEAMLKLNNKEFEQYVTRP